MLAKSLLLGCLAVTSEPGEFSRAAAIKLHGAGCFVEAADHMAEVYRRAATPDERRAAAAFVAGALRDAFVAAADKDAAAPYLCRGLAMVDEFVASGGEAATEAERRAAVATPRAKLAQLRQPFGACEQPAAEALLTVRASGRPRPRPRPVMMEAPQPAPGVPSPGRAMGWAGVGVTTLGVGAVAIGLGLGLSRGAAAAAGADALTAGAPGRGFTDMERQQLQDLHGELSEAKLLLGAVVGAGAALLVTGAVLTAVGWKRRGADRAAFLPGRRGMGLTLRF